MKFRVLVLLVVCCPVLLAAWLMQSPRSAQADEIPEKYRDTVSKGLEYLVKNQHKDGHWEGDDGKHPVAMTALVGIALLMEKSDERGDHIKEDLSKRKYLANVNKAVDWLLDRARPERDGLIFSDHPSETDRYMEGHGLATLFLAGAHEDVVDKERQKKLNDVLTRAVKYIVRAQSSRGGWYHTSKVEGHDLDAISTTVIQIQALEAAKMAGLPVPRESIGDAQKYLAAAMAKYDQPAEPGKNPKRSTDTASVVAVRIDYDIQDIGGMELRDHYLLFAKWWEYCQAHIPVGGNSKLERDELTHYYYAQALRRTKTNWINYRAVMFDFLQSFFRRGMM